jgi:acetate---CoA ligase (ADP-forming)
MLLWVPMFAHSAIKKLLNPESAAVIGASNTKGKPGEIIFRRLEESGLRLYPVNPGEGEVRGIKAYPDIAAIPELVDVAVITTGAATAADVAEDCAKHGIGCLIIIAGGFGETGPEGTVLEERLKEVCREYGVRVLGPNSLGVFVPESGFDTIFVEHGDRSLARGGGVAFISQSGSVGVESLGLASNTGFGMRAFVGLGNKIDLTEQHFLEYFRYDPGTDCLAFYVENVETGRQFLETAKQTSREKPVVVLKAGRTEAGATAVSSHTGRLAGSDKVVSGAFKQFGIQRAFDDEELCDAAKVLSAGRRALGGRVAVLTGAGGFGVMCTDYIESRSRRADLVMAELSESTTELIEKNAPSFASIRNPVDLTAAMTNEMYTAALDALLDDPGVDVVICIAFFSPPGITDSLIDDIAVSARGSGKPVVVFCEYGPYTDRYLKALYTRGVAGFPSLSRVVRAVRFLVERGHIVDAIREDAGE